MDIWDLELYLNGQETTFLDRDVIEKIYMGMPWGFQRQRSAGKVGELITLVARICLQNNGVWDFMNTWSYTCVFIFIDVDHYFVVCKSIKMLEILSLYW